MATVLSGWLGFGWLSGEVRQISRRLDALAETVSVGGGDTNLVRMAKAARTQMSSEGLRIELVDVQITVAAEGARAIASMTVQGPGLDFATGDQMIDAREVEMTLVKLDGEWLIQGVSAVSAIRRPGTPAPLRDRP